MEAWPASRPGCRTHLTSGCSPLHSRSCCWVPDQRNNDLTCLLRSKCVNICHQGWQDQPRLIPLSTRSLPWAEIRSLIRSLKLVKPASYSLISDIHKQIITYLNIKVYWELLPVLTGIYLTLIKYVLDEKWEIVSLNCG